MNDGLPEGSENMWKRIYWISAAVIFIAMSIFSQSAGISGDEFDMNEYGKESLHFYSSLGKDTSSFNMNIDRDKAFKYYGAFFDITAATFNKISPLPEYDTRHLLNSWFGFVTMLVCGLIVFRIAGWRAALIAIWFLFLSPRFTGHSLNNPKDIPFAMSFMIATLGIVRLMDEMPKPRWSSLLLVIMGIGFAIGTRIGGLMLFGYLGLFLGLDFLLKRKEGAKMMGYVKFGALTGVGGYILGLLLWPYGLLSPIDRPLATLERVSNLPISLRQLFEGQHIMSENLPWYYLPKYIMITNPLIIIAGFVIAALLIYQLLKRYDTTKVFIAFFGFLFPIAYILYKDSNVFGGWRHTLFTYPYLVIAASLGWETLLRMNRQKAVMQKVVAGVLVLGLVPVAAWTVSSNPYQYTYFNETVGGLNGAYGNYETDYYYHSMREASEWLIDSLELKETDSIVVASNAPMQLKYFFRDYPGVKQVYSHYYERNRKLWDYGIFCVKTVNRSEIVNGNYPPGNTLYSVQQKGATFAVVLDRPSTGDVEGIEKRKLGDMIGALTATDEYLKTDPNNADVLSQKAELLVNMGQIDSALKVVEYGRRFYPDHVGLQFNKALGLVQQNRIPEAVLTLKELLKTRQNVFSAHYYLGYCYAQQGQYSLAVESLNEAIKYSPRFKPAYTLAAQCYQALGQNENAQRYQEAAARVQ